MSQPPQTTIDLRACDVIGISLPDEAARRASLTALGADLGLPLRILNAVRCKPGWLGCCLSHIAALRAGQSDSPLLVLEDDVAAERPFEPRVAVPADADAVYLGVSLYGGVESFAYDGLNDVLALEPAAPGLFRAHNMLSSHAILHITPRWRTAALEVMIDCATSRGWAPDRGLASIQSDFRVYALERPMFYQAEALQGESNQALQERATRTPLTAQPVGTVMTFWTGERDLKLILVRDGERLAWRSV